MKDKKIYITIILATLLSIFCIVQIVLPNNSYQYSGEVFIGNGLESTTRTIYKKIPLPLGIYNVGLEYDSELGGVNSCMIVEPNMVEGKLRTNGEVLGKGVGETEFRMWLFGDTENLEVQIFNGGEGDLSIYGINFYETNALWSIVLTLIWGMAGVIIGITYLYKLSNRANLNKNVILGLILLIVISSLPCLYGGNLNGTNLFYHLNRIEEVQEGIRLGVFPLRVEPTLYIPAILRLIGYTVTTSYNIYCILINVATVLISYFCFTKIFGNQQIGVLCSALYTLSIYRIYKFFVLTAVDESLAFMFFSLLFYALYRVFSEDENEKEYKKIWIPLAIAYAGLLQTHMLSFAIAIVVTIFVIIIFSIKKFKKEVIIEIVKGLFSAMILSVWYVLPWIDYYKRVGYFTMQTLPNSIQKNGIYMAQMFQNWWRFGTNETWNEAGMRFSQPVGVGFILGITFFFFIILWFSGKLRRDRNTVYFGKIMTVIAGVSMFMSMNFFPWDRIQKIHVTFHKLIGIIRRPDVFLGMATVCLVLVSGVILHYLLLEKSKQYFCIAAICILIAIVTSSIYLQDFICRDHPFVQIFDREGINVIDSSLLEMELMKTWSWNLSLLISCIGWIYIVVIVVRKKVLEQKEKRKKNGAITDKKI